MRKPKQNPKNIKAGEILSAIRMKYTKSQFIPEISIQSGGKERRLDAWVLKPGYKPITAVGFEIKTSRADWLNDQKWPEYLATCQEFYFVTPSGVMRKEEVPEMAGLMHATVWRVDEWTNKYGDKGTRNVVRLRVIKKAPRRDITLPERFMVGIIRNRMDRPYTYHSNKSGFDSEAFLAAKKDQALRAKAVNSRIHALVGMSVTEIEAFKRNTTADLEKCRDIKKWLDRKGIALHELQAWNMDSEMERITKPEEAQTLRDDRRFVAEVKAHMRRYANLGEGAAEFLKEYGLE
jgi:hypothetical protein